MKQPSIVISLVIAASSSGQPLTLEQALAAARANRPAVHSAQLMNQSARQSARAIGTHPGLMLGIGHSSREDLGATDQDFFVSQTVDVFGRTAALRRLGASQVRTVEAEGAQLLLSIQGEVLRTYFEAAAASRLSEVAIDLLSIAESLHRATVSRFEQGKVSEVQVIRATIELDRAKQMATLRTSQLQAALSRLSGAVGIDSIPDGVDASATLGAPPLDFERRPDILGLRAQVQVAEAEAVAASRAGLPELELSALRTPWRERPASYGARIQLTWRILDFGRARSEQGAARKQAEALRASLSDVRKKAETELAAINLEIAAAEQRIKSHEAIRKAALDLLEKSQRGYTEGFGSLLEVLEATRSLREIQQELAEAQLALNLATVAKYQAAGALIEVTK